MQSSQNRIIIGIIILSVIFVGVYYTGQQQVGEAVSMLQLEFSDLDLTRLSLIPPEVDITLIYTVINPSDIPLEITVNGLLYYGNTVISPINVEERMIPAMGSGEIGVEMTLNGTLLQAIGDPENEGNYRLEGTLSATGRFMDFLPVSVKIDLSELQSEN